MGIEYLQLYQYRNLENSKINLESPCVVLRGENGQGKTNFLEAVYFLCYASSFRSTKEKNIVSYGEDSVSVNGKVKPEDKDSYHLTVYIDKGKKGIKKDGKIVRDRKEIIKNSPCVVFTHQDINYASGSQDLKRRFIDQVISLFDLNYIDQLRKYKLLLKQRNAVLKEQNLSILDIYDLQLAEVGWIIQQIKEKVHELFNEDFIKINNKINTLPESLSLVYNPSWKKVNDSNDVLEKLKQNRKRDLITGQTNTGPHRDKFLFKDGDMDYSENASTGQLRLLSLILKMSQARFIYKKAGLKPILLIDDVLLELDGKNTEKVLDNLPVHEQAFYTFLPEEKSQVKYSSILHYTVKNGSLI